MSDKEKTRRVRTSGLLLILFSFLIYTIGSLGGPGRQFRTARRGSRDWQNWTWTAFSKAKLKESKPGEYVWPGMGVVRVDPAWQKHVESTVEKFKPPYVAVLIQDQETGQVLAAVGFDKSGSFSGQSFQHPILGQKFVAASVVKTPFAAVLMERGIASPATMAPCTAVYKVANGAVENALRHEKGPQTLAQTLATSCNTVMARYAQKTGWPPILEMLDRVGWLSPALGVPATLPGEAPAKAEDLLLSQSASGYGHVFVGPWHMLALTSALSGEGQGKAPRFINPLTPWPDSVVAQCGPPCEEKQPRFWSDVVGKQLLTAHEGTVHDPAGTGHKAFYHNNKFRLPSDIEVFGKTGSLDSDDPKGFLTWFIGAVEKDGKPKLAVVSLVINEPTWKVKAAGLMGEILANFPGGL